MKNTLIPALITLTTALVGDCLAVSPVTEDFSAPLDGFRWHEYRVGKGKLLTDSGKLNFVVKGTPTADDFASIELLFNQGGVNENWEMTVDFTNIAKITSHAGCGFMIFNSFDRQDYVYMNYYSSYGISSGVFDNFKHTAAPKLSMAAVRPIGAVRVRYASSTGVLTFSVSMTSKEEGYRWKELGTFSPTAGGTADVVANWDMGKGQDFASGFGFQLFGAAESSRVPVGKVTIDNFRLRPLPQ